MRDRQTDKERPRGRERFMRDRQAKREREIKQRQPDRQ